MAGRRKKASSLVQIFLTARAGRAALSTKLATRELYPGQDAFLLALGEADGISLRDLATRLAVKPPTITKTVTRMAAQGLIEKRASPHDARQHHAFLTEKGAALLDEVRSVQKSVERAALAGFSDRDRKRLKKLLRRVEENLGAAPPAGPMAAEQDD